MDPFFTEEQLNNMSRENMMEVMRIMQNQVQKKETEVQLLKDKQKELEFMNAMLSDRLALAQRRRFGSSSEKYADGSEQMDMNRWISLMRLKSMQIRILLRLKRKS